MMRAVVTGATGFIGVPLCKTLKSAGWKITVLARGVNNARQLLGDGFEIISWSPADEIPDTALRDANVVINLAGESINDRWTRDKKRRILDSRVSVSRRIVEALEKNIGKPEVLINASAIGYYGPREDEKLCESEQPGADFLASVCKAWEDEAFKAESLGVRVAAIRTGVVLGDGGALSRMVRPFKLFAGGPIGSGEQWVSWVHIDDLIGIIKFVAENKLLSGPINATAPEPVTMGDLSRAIGRVVNKPSWLPVPGMILKIALGEMSDLILNGQRVIPCKALQAGYKFRHASVELALRDIL